VLAAAFAAVQLSTSAILPGVGPGLTLLLAATIVLLALGQVLAGGLQGARRFSAVGLSRVAEIVVKVAVGLFLVAFVGLGFLGVVWALFVSAAVVVVLAAWALRDRLPGPGTLSGVRAFTSAGPMAVGTATFGMLGTLDVLLLPAIGGAHGVTLAVVAVYQAAAVLARAPFLLGKGISDAVFPFIAKARTTAEAHRWFLAGFRWLPLAIIPAQLTLLISPGALLGLMFPADYADGADLVRIITIGTTGAIAIDMLLKALYARGRATTVAVRMPGVVVVQLIGMLVLVPELGAIGAAISYAAANWIGAGLLAMAYLRPHLSASVPMRTAVGWLGAIGGLVSILLAATLVPRPLDLLVMVLGLACYAAIAVRLRLVPEAEIERIRARLTRRRTETYPTPSEVAQ
jgi:O-antigen/teichoic acid export membrane protein